MITLTLILNPNPNRKDLDQVRDDITIICLRFSQNMESISGVLDTPTPSRLEESDNGVVTVLGENGKQRPTRKALTRSAQRSDNLTLKLISATGLCGIKGSGRYVLDMVHILSHVVKSSRLFTDQGTINGHFFFFSCNCCFFTLNLTLTATLTLRQWNC